MLSPTRTKKAMCVHVFVRGVKVKTDHLFLKLKAQGQDAQIKFLAKLNIVKTTPNFACEFVYVC